MAQGNGYTADAWAAMGPYNQSPYSNSPMNEYGSWSGYPAPPPPSMPPAVAETPVTVSRPVEVPRTGTLPRKTLSMEQKRAMCQYSEDNPGIRQMDIGKKFGVERSTVSKVLRQKDQYLKRDQEDQSSSKKAKGRHPDFDRTLSNYVRRQQQRGVEVKDEEIIKHAKLFARASDNHESLVSSLSGGWLQKFKHRHGIGSGRLMRRASDTNIPDTMNMSTPRIRQRRRSGDTAADAIISPMSPPPAHMSPLSEAGSEQDDMPPEGLGLDFSYRPTASQSATSLTNDVSFSPGGAFTFSPDPGAGGSFALSQQMGFGSTAATAADMLQNHREKRSNTFPSLNIESVNGISAPDPMTPRHLSSASTLDSPLYGQRPFPIDTSSSAITSPPTLHRSASNQSLTARSNTTPVESSPVSPSHEDARRAASTLLNYIQNMSSNGQFEQNEYLMLVQLTKKLQVHQHQPSRSIGGLSRIPEGEGELVTHSHTISPAEAHEDHIG
ncbi:CENP-B N-terminal DNA-binding domain [Geosmithia morbida]|uniref:CENP-B N-terminal DNA-binding domain n=1 Tax=Geosmithia morbida TaxID=1094350 RepID=A0A9P4YQF1_9HYPO|nr:CENP-B N-terminal DNA-binding domain [Geosmithia morbida]KAF4121223.1 CENP-B N-terminal DNA-binding domain [Geosmithia morbida]